MESSAYLRLLIFLLAILIPACASSSPAFLMMYSAYKLNKQGDNIQPWCTPFPIWNQSVVPCPVLTVASWPAYRFLRWLRIPINIVSVFSFYTSLTVRKFCIWLKILICGIKKTSIWALILSKMLFLPSWWVICQLVFETEMTVHGFSTAEVDSTLNPLHCSKVKCIWGKILIYI